MQNVNVQNVNVQNLNDVPKVDCANSYEILNTIFFAFFLVLDYRIQGDSVCLHTVHVYKQLSDGYRAFYYRFAKAADEVVPKFLMILLAGSGYTDVV